MRVCVTGGAGFIGSYFLPSLVGDGHEVTILDVVRPRFDVGDARVVQGDVRDPDAVASAMEGCDALLHLAAAHRDFGISEREYYSVNEGGARILCDQMDSQGITSACFYSTVLVYGDAPEPRSEVTPPRPLTLYGKSKLAAEAVFREWAEARDGRSCLVMRPAVTIGPGNFANMYTLIRQIHSGKFLPIGSGLNIKSLAHVDNLVEATRYLWNLGEDARFQDEGPFAIFNYADEPNLTSGQIIDACYRALGKKPPVFTIPLTLALLFGIPFDAAIALTGKNLPISTARMKKLCTETKYDAGKVRRAGFVPRVSLQDGIDEMVRWFLVDGRRGADAQHRFTRGEVGERSFPADRQAAFAESPGSSSV